MCLLEACVVFADTISSIKSYSDKYEHAPSIFLLPRVASVIRDQSASKDQVKELTQYSSKLVLE